jgi:hypothetical protein
VNVTSLFVSRRIVSFVCVLVATVALHAASARAYHDSENRSLEETAYVLRHREWQVGPLRLAVGLSRCQLGTRTAPWIVGAALTKLMPNLGLDCSVWDRGRATVTLQSELYFVNSRKLSDSDSLVRLWVIPVGIAGSWRFDDEHTLSARFRYVHVTTDADATEDDVELHGGGLAPNAQLSASWTWRLTHVTALVSSFRYLAYQGDPVFTSTVDVDEDTTATVDAQFDASELQHSVAASVSALMSWKSFNLRAGVAYGALFLAGPGIVLPLKYPYPEVNVYWRL